MSQAPLYRDRSRSPLAARGWRFVAALSCLVLLTWASAAFAGGPALPARIQAVLFKKIFHYDRTFARAPVSVLVAHPRGELEQAQELVKAFGDVGITASAVDVDEVGKQLRQGIALYVWPGVSTAPFKELAAKSKVLTISGSDALARAGDVGIAVAPRADGKPEILVNLARVKEEGHELSSDLLRVATILQ